MHSASKSSKKEEKVDDFEDFPPYCISTDMTISQRQETDNQIMDAFSLHLTTLKEHKKQIPKLYRPYMNPAFREFSSMCASYKKLQLDRKRWKFGEVWVPSIVYMVRDIEKDAKEHGKFWS